MSNSLQALLAMQKAAAAKKAAESAPAPTTNQQPVEPHSKPVAEPPVVNTQPHPPESTTGGTPKINGLAGLLALQKKSADPASIQPADSPAQTPTTVIPPVVQQESVPVPASAYPSLETIADMDEKGLSEVDLSQAIRLDLDRLDALLIRDTGINAFNIDDCRSIITRIMPELKKNPIYAGLVVDKDVHNIMTFCLSTQQVAVIENATKKNKEVKAKGKSAVKAAMGKALANMSIPGIGDMEL